MSDSSVRDNRDMLERHFDKHECDTGKLLLFEACRLEQVVENMTRRIPPSRGDQVAEEVKSFSDETGSWAKKETARDSRDDSRGIGSGAS